MPILFVGIFLCLVAAAVVVFMFLKTRKPRAEIQADDVATMAAYIRAEQQQKQAIETAKQEKKELSRAQLETFKQTKEQLRDKLKSQLDEKQWKPLESVLKSVDKGGVGIYVLYNETKNKYYVGQAKQLLKRVRDHFVVEDIARDYMNGDKIQVKFLTANELDADYRLDHIEKTGIELFNAGKTGYNKTEGNV